MSHEKLDQYIPRSKKMKSAPSREIICLDDVSASSTNHHPGLSFSLGTSNAVASARLPARSNANHYSTVTTVTVNNDGSRRSPASGGQIVDHGTNPVFDATVSFACNSGVFNPRRILSTMTNSFQDRMEETTIVGTTIYTLLKYKKKITLAALTDHHTNGFPITRAARGNVSWIERIIKSLQTIKRNLRYDLIDLNHLKNGNHLSAEYQSVAAAIKCPNVADGAVVLVAWIVSENPNDESLTPNRNMSTGVYESQDFSFFRSRYNSIGN